MKRVVAATLVCTATIFGAGCGVKKQLDEMHDSTVNMNRTTGKLSASTEELDRKTAELYDALRQGDSLSVRRNQLQALLGAKEMPRKISEAGKYFMAFEFQIWSSMGRDKDERREELAALGVREFLKDVHDFIGVDPKVEPFASGEKDEANRARSLNALATAMHILNPKQEETLREHSVLKPISVYGMIEEALRAGREIESGARLPEEYPQYIREVLAQEKTAVFLMQVRYNFLGVLALGRTVPLDRMKKAYISSKSKAAGKLIDAFSKTDLVADMSQHNLVEIREFTSYLQGALRTHALLLEIGETPQMDPALTWMYEALQVKMSQADDGDVTSKSSSLARRLALEAEFFDIVTRYKTSASAPLSEAVSLPETKVEEKNGALETKDAVETQKKSLGKRVRAFLKQRKAN